jgi:hypothetical protein
MVVLIPTVISLKVASVDVILSDAAPGGTAAGYGEPGPDVEAGP